MPVDFAVYIPLQVNAVHAKPHEPVQFGTLLSCNYEDRSRSDGGLDLSFLLITHTPLNKFHNPSTNKTSEFHATSNVQLILIYHDDAANIIIIIMLPCLPLTIASTCIMPHRALRIVGLY